MKVLSSFVISSTAKPMTHAVRTVMIALLATFALGIVQMPDTEANASVATIDDDPPPPQPQSNLPTITIAEGTEYGYMLESSQAAPFILTRSDAAAGTLTVDVNVTQDEFGGYVASENLGPKTITLEFGADGTARYEVPTLIHAHHHNGHVDVEIVEDSTDPAEYSVGDPSSARVTILHEHEPTPVPDPTATPIVENISATFLFLLGPEEAVPEGSDAEFTLIAGCGPGGPPPAIPPCGDVSVSIRVAQAGDFIDTHQYESPDEHHDHEEDEHHDEDEHHGDEEDEHHDDAFQFQTVTIPNGSDRTTISVPTDDDDIAETDGRIFVFLLAVDNDWTTGSRVFLPAADQGGIASATITSDDLPVVTVSLPDESARTEGDDIVFQLDRTGPMFWPEVPVRIQPGDTGNFLQSSETTTVTIPANRVSTTHTVHTINDDVDEEHGSVTLTVLDDDADPAVYEVGAAKSATATVADDDPLDLRFDDPDDASGDQVPVTKAIPVPQSGSVRYTLRLPKRPASDVTVRIESDNPDVTVQPSQIIFSVQSPQTLSISQPAQTSDSQTSTFSARSPQGPAIAHAMYTADSQASILTVPWDHAAPVNIIPKRNVTSGIMAKLTHRLNCLVNGSGCGYSGAEEDISVQLIAPDVARPLISRIEPTIRNVTVSPSDEVVLTVDIFGRQNIQNQSLGTYLIEWSQGNDRIQGYNGAKMTYTAPSEPGTYTVNARVAGNACSGDSDDCSAKFDITVRRPATPEPKDEPAVNPPGSIPSIIADDQGNQYEVFTPEEGGRFDGGAYSISASPGAVPNGEVVGLRMDESGSASNVGMTRHRYTLVGNSYAVSAVDSSGDAVSEYRLNAPVEVCMPLPAEGRRNISDIALVVGNADGSQTVLSASVRIVPSGVDVCGDVSEVPATVSVGVAGAPAPIPTPLPLMTPEAPDTGGGAPSGGALLLLLFLGLATVIVVAVPIWNHDARDA